MPYTFEELHRGQREEVDFALPVAQGFRAWQAQWAEGRPFEGRGRVLGRFEDGEGWWNWRKSKKMGEFFLCVKISTQWIINCYKEKFHAMSLFWLDQRGFVDTTLTKIRCFTNGFQQNCPNYPIFHDGGYT